MIRRAFTLIELLVVIAIIAVLIGVLIPALAAAREAGRQTVGLSNLRACAMTQHAYALDFNGSFVNPFDKDNQARWGVAWFDIVAQASLNAPNGGPIQSYFYGQGGYTSQLFGITWMSLMTQYLTTSSMTSDVMLHPSDAAAWARLREGRPRTFGVQDGVLFDTSYFASPTTWLSPSVYKQSAQTNTNAVSSWRRNRFDEVTSPQAKVIVFERFDFSRKSRPHRAGGRENFSPNFNNPEATTRFALADGSVDNIKMSKLHGLAVAANTTDVFKPCGIWDPSDFILVDPLSTPYRAGYTGRDGLENGDGSMLGIPGGFNSYLSFFWSTRLGIQGRDIHR